jgi:hypothetical protein
LEMLPNEIGDVTSLKRLNLCYSNIGSIPPSIWKLKNLQDIELVRADGEIRCGDEKLSYSVACNRARLRLGSGTREEGLLQRMPALWPLLLSSPTRAFGGFERFSPSVRFRMTEPDAIYQLLIDGGESFVSPIRSWSRYEPRNGSL